jgi:hypothetical protein
MVVSIISLAVLMLFIGASVWSVRARSRAAHRYDAFAKLPIDFVIPMGPPELRAEERNLAKIQAEIADASLLPGERTQLLLERNRIARESLAAFHQDFKRLDKLGFACRALSSSGPSHQRIARLLRELQFAVQYSIANLCLTVGAFPTGSMKNLRALLDERARAVAMQLQAIDAELANEPRR